MALNIIVKGSIVIVLIILALILAIKEEIKNFFAMITGAIAIIVLILWMMGYI